MWLIIYKKGTGWSKINKARAEKMIQAGRAFPRSVKRGILEWIATAKKSETRAKRVEETARLAAENIHANQWRQ